MRRITYIFLFFLMMNLGFGVLYEKVICEGNMEFYESTQEFSSGSDMYKGDSHNPPVYFVGSKQGDSDGFEGTCRTSNCGTITTLEQLYYNPLDQPIHPTWRFLCVEDNSGLFSSVEDEKIVGYCDIQEKTTPEPTPEPEPTPPPEPEPTPSNCDATLADGTTILINHDSSLPLYEFKLVPSNYNCEDLKITLLCDDGTISTEPYTLNYDKYYTTCSNEGDWTKDIILDIEDETWELNDFETFSVGRIKYDFTTKDFIYYNRYGGIDILVNPEKNTGEITKQIELCPIFDTTCNTKEDIRFVLMALNGHRLKRFHNKDEAQKYLDETYAMMNKINIRKEVTADIDKTNIKIKLDTSSLSQGENLVAYLIISKEDVPEGDFDRIKIFNSGSGNYFVVDKDPIIGWYFNDSDEIEEIEYELPGNNEGGTIILTQEPILYNNGELIVNYRETVCGADEAYLFDLEDLIDSNVYNALENEFYKVCVAHISEDLSASKNNNFLSILNYTDNDKMSISKTLPEESAISVNNNNLYWDMKIQELSPSGNYSCLGSFDNTADESLFGDCDYIEESRIWIHLGADYYAPTTSIISPKSIGHLVKIGFEAIDNIYGSGVENTYYCIKNETNNDCSYSSGNFKVYNPPNSITITCLDGGSCQRELFYFSKDNYGNIEEMKSEILQLVEIGSSCQETCIASPSPNRYFKNCNNVNGCEFYNTNKDGIFDDGKYVASQCHYMIEDSWVKYDETQEIKCPNGPFRKSIYSQEELDFSKSKCEHLKYEDYEILLNGEMISMKIVVCD